MARTRAEVLHRIAFFWLLAAIWVALVVWISLDPNPPGARYLHRLVGLVSDSNTAVIFAQAVLHLLIYALGAAAFANALAATMPQLRRAWLFVLAFVIVIALGAMLEILQDRVPNRAADLRDLLGDMIGALLYLGLAWFRVLGPFRSHRQGPSEDSATS